MHGSLLYQRWCHHKIPVYISPSLGVNTRKLRTHYDWEIPVLTSLGFTPPIKLLRELENFNWYRFYYINLHNTFLYFFENAERVRG